MAQDSIAQSGIPLNPAGMNDNVPLEKASNFYQTRGVHSLSEMALQRCNGKRLFHKLSCPVLAIHGDLRERVLVETSCALYQFDHLEDDLPDITPAPVPTTGLVLHLEADSLALSDDDTVAVWDDQSGMSNDVAQVSAPNQPTYKENILNGLPIVRFAGNHRLDSIITANFNFVEATIFVIRNNQNSFSVLSIDDGVSPLTDDFTFADKRLIHQSTPGNSTSLSHQDNFGGYFLQTGRFGNTPLELELWINGILSTELVSTSGVVADYNPVNRWAHVGGRLETPLSYVNCDVAAVLVYNYKLTEPDRAAVETYLTNKYAL